MDLKYCTILTLLMLILTVVNVNSQTTDIKKQSPLILYVLIHTPCENWVDSLSFREQHGVKDHIDYMSAFLDNKKLLLGGPFLDNSGGMMICKVESSDEAEKIANDDPAVKNGLLKVEVKKWYAAMSGLN